MVTSTGSGLAVPDWPLSYGMLFPPMVGGVFYEHGHRLVAATVGFFMLVLTITIWRFEKRRWVRYLGLTALFTVIAQGVLGGITVLFFLPAPVSVTHGILAQIFFALTILIAYSFSQERQARLKDNSVCIQPQFLRAIIFFTTLVYIQLILGSLMRHTGSGLAIPDFPTMGGYLIPPFNRKMLSHINHWRFVHNLDPVTMKHVVIHFLHRLGALIIFLFLGILNLLGASYSHHQSKIKFSMNLLNILTLFQIGLGILTVLSGKTPLLTTFHVVTGAALLGSSVLLLLRAAPISLVQFNQLLFQ